MVIMALFSNNSSVTSFLFFRKPFSTGEYDNEEAMQMGSLKQFDQLTGVNER